MIDPTNITNFNLTEEQLEEHVLWWVCAAGKNGVTAAKCLDNLLNYWKFGSPFETIRKIDNLEQELKRFGIGCYKSKAKAFKQLVNSGINLKTCTVEELEEIHGVGPKTSRCFLLHSRLNQRYAGLDRHLLNYLRELGYFVPKSTPTGNKYRQIEKIFLELADKSGKTISQLDLEIWSRSRK